VVLLKWVYKHRVICEINELRRSIVKNFIPHRKRYKNDILRFSNFIRYYYYRFNEILTKYFDGLIVISTNLETYYKKYNNNIIRIPILSDKFEDNTPRKSFISINDPFIISFTGQIDLRKEGIDILFKALSLLKGDFRNFKLFLYGPVSRNDKEILEGLAKRLGIQDDIVFKGIVPQHQIHKILIESHLLLLLRPNNLQNQYGFSTKLAEYLVSGTPVLISAVSDNTLYIKDGENGFVVNEMNENEIASKLFWIIINYTKVVETIKYNSLKTADEIFHYKNYVQIFKRFIPGQ
jgi:glycosyltransferase involved in cell wall biosynthesis